MLRSGTGWLAAALALGVLAGCFAGCDRAPRRLREPPFTARDIAQAGFDAPVELRVQRPPGAPDGEITWVQIKGPPARELRVSERGFVLSLRTPGLAEVHPEPLPHGLVPLSPSTRGELAFEATWRGASGYFSRIVRVSAAARATGIPSVPLGQRVLLGGEGWRVVERPAQSHAEVEGGSTTTFQPDVAGRWVLHDASGARLSLRTARYDRPALDCGRSECHASAAASAQASPMTRSLFSRLADPNLADPGCLLGCHSAGEPGNDDGGFEHTAHTMELHRLPSWDGLPRALRRLGGVGCMSCHGPGAIPEPDARWAILRADVCATCHDDPPRYTHVAAWKRSRMAHAAQTPGPANPREGRCAQCHTTAGFLHEIKARAGSPAPTETGVACAACHAPHQTHESRLLRVVPTPASLGDASPGVCLRCHAPLPDEPIASASEAALLLGRGGQAPGPAPHAGVSGGCVGCHMTAPRGENHAFKADPGRCAPCHTTPPVEAPSHGASLQKRARSLWESLVARGMVRSSQPPAHAGAELSVGLSPGQRRAIFDLSLVLQDPAAWVHNGAYARALLDGAERALASP